MSIYSVAEMLVEVDTMMDHGCIVMNDNEITVEKNLKLAKYLVQVITYESTVLKIVFTERAKGIRKKKTNEVLWTPIQEGLQPKYRTVVFNPAFVSEASQIQGYCTCEAFRFCSTGKEKEWCKHMEIANFLFQSGLI